MALELVTAPASEPLTLTESKDYLNVTDASRDSFITGLITAMRECVESYTHRTLITQTWRMWLDTFPGSRTRASLSDGVNELPTEPLVHSIRTLELKRSPVQSVTHIKTYGEDHSASVFSAGSYFVDTASQPGRVVLNANAQWPTQLRSANAVELEFIAGYGNTSDVPRPLKEGMLLWMKLLFADQSWLLEAGDPVPGLMDLNRWPLPPQVKTLWDPYRIHSL